MGSSDRKDCPLCSAPESLLAGYFILFSLYWVNFVRVSYSYKYSPRRIGKRLVLEIVLYNSVYLLSKYT